jgi:hypothetical protein
MHGKSGAHGTEAEKRIEFGDGTPDVKKKKPLKT